jgi:hypothetical protein
VTNEVSSIPSKGNLISSENIMGKKENTRGIPSLEIILFCVFKKHLILNGTKTLHVIVSIHFIVYTKIYRALTQ